MEKHVNYDMCRECGGVCCKHNGCIYSPNDFKRLDFNNIKKELDKGNISIGGQPIEGILGDGWTFFLYLRARNVDADIVDLFTKGGPCKMLSENGCLYPESKRPTFGLLVKPTKIGGPCEKKYDVNRMLDWFNYYYVLERLVKHYTGKEVFEVVADQLAERIYEINKKLSAGEELTCMEDKARYWGYRVIHDKPYYSPDDVKKLKLTFTGR